MEVDWTYLAAHPELFFIAISMDAAGFCVTQDELIGEFQPVFQEPARTDHAEVWRGLWPYGKGNHDAIA